MIKQYIMFSSVIHRYKKKKLYLRRPLMSYDNEYFGSQAKSKKIKKNYPV